MQGLDLVVQLLSALQGDVASVTSNATIDAITNFAHSGKTVFCT